MTYSVVKRRGQKEEFNQAKIASAIDYSFDYELEDEKLDEIETEFDTRMNRILAVYEPFPSLEDAAKYFLLHAYKAWDLFRNIMSDRNFDPKHIIEEGGRCQHKAELLITFCRELGITSVKIRGYRDGVESNCHSLNAVKTDATDDGWEIDDPTQDKKQIKESRYFAKCILSKKPGQKIINAEFEPLEQEKVNK